MLNEEKLPRVTEPEDPDEERTKPDGIKLWDEESSEAADVEQNKPAGFEAVHADTWVVITMVGVTIAGQYLVSLSILHIEEAYFDQKRLAVRRQTVQEQLI